MNVGTPKRYANIGGKVAQCLTILVPLGALLGALSAHVPVRIWVHSVAGKQVRSPAGKPHLSFLSYYPNRLCRFVGCHPSTFDKSRWRDFRTGGPSVVEDGLASALAL